MGWKDRKENGKSQSCLYRNNSSNRFREGQGWAFAFDGVSFRGWRGLGREDVSSTETVKIEEGQHNEIEIAVSFLPMPDGPAYGWGDLITIATF